MCGKVAAAGTKSQRVTVATRPKEYPGTVEPPSQRRFGRFREAPKQRDRGGRGHEIVKELVVCSTCAAAHQEKQAELEAAAKAAAEEAAVLAAQEAAAAEAAEKEAEQAAAEAAEAEVPAEG